MCCASGGAEYCGMGGGACTRTHIPDEHTLHESMLRERKKDADIKGGQRWKIRGMARVQAVRGINDSVVLLKRITPGCIAAVAEVGRGTGAQAAEERSIAAAAAAVAAAVPVGQDTGALPASRMSTPTCLRLKNFLIPL